MKGTEEEKQKHSHSAFPSKRFFLKNSLNRSWWSMRALLVFSGVLVACLTSFSLLTMLSSVSSLRLNKGSSVWRTFGRSNTVWKSLSTLKGGATNSSPLTVDHPSFDRVRDFNVKEFGLQGSIYNHKKSGAQVISVIAPDDNKVFGITFRTPPTDSTGVPHILEHSVLCGSRKYPVKEPFVDLLRGSLQNFLNAFTYPDRTCYPVASTNTKDFYNLVNVYLDAVLHPRAINDPMVLQQEGWHYELDKRDDPLTVKGVVFNEMKGVYSSPESLLGRAAQQALFPENTYGVDSGGDPKDITKLTFPQFKEFHSRFYHPNNSRIFFYGNDDPMKRLDLLEEYLVDFPVITPTTATTASATVSLFQSPSESSKVKFQPKRELGTKQVVAYPIAPDSEPKHMVTVNWLLNDQPFTPKEALAIEILDYLLLGTSTSVLRKTLTESGLGESVLGGGLSDELLQASFSTGLKGVKSDDVEKVQELIFSTLIKIAEKDGFESDAITAAVNTLEFKLREFNTGSFPKGLSIMLAMMKNWIYDKDPIDAITFEQALNDVKNDIATGKPIFQDLLKKYIINNKHYVTIEMKPDVTLEERQLEEERKELEDIKKTMSESDLDRIIEETKALRERQEAIDPPEARAMLPKLNLEDIDKKTRPYPAKTIYDSRSNDQNTPNKDMLMLTHALPTSNIIYVDIGLDYRNVDIEDLQWIPLFSRMLMEAGTKNYDATTLSRQIGTYTGGIGVSFYNDITGKAGHISNPLSDDYLLYLFLRGKTMPEHLNKMIELMKEILLYCNLNNQNRAIEMLKEIKARKESSILSSGHSYASTRLSSSYSLLGYMSELTGGLTSVRNAGKLLEQAETNWSDVQKALERIRDRIVIQSPIDQSTESSSKKARKIVVNLTGNEEVLDNAVTAVKSFIDILPTTSTSTSSTTESDLVTRWRELHRNNRLPYVRRNGRHEAFTMPSMVNYVGYGGELYTSGESVSGSSSVVTRTLSSGYLWDTVRVLGGAYGGFAKFSEISGKFVYLSYRDPNLHNTLQAYHDAADFLHNEADRFNDEDILQSVIGTIGDLDAPMSNDQLGYSSFIHYLLGEDESDRQQWRDDVLNTKADDFKAFALRLKKLRETGSTVVFGSQTAIEQANQQLPEGERLIVESALVNNKKE